MSKAPPSPLFRPPTNVRRDLLPKLNRLSLGPPAAPLPASEENSNPPVSSGHSGSSSEEEAPHPAAKEVSPPSLSPPIFRPKPDIQIPDEDSHENNPNGAPAKAPADDDIYALDDEGWRRVALASGIEQLLKLGEGASGAVHKCRLRKSGQVFAMKTITSDATSPEHILRELKVNQSCVSPFIVKFFGAFAMTDSTTAIAMEFCEGRSLEGVYKMVQRRGGRTHENVLGKIACGVLGGLTYLHEKHIIHRDVKPGNILLTRKGEVKLCDFGISKELVDSLCGTGEQTFVGTQLYMAPERIQGHAYNIRSDLWSLGITLMEVAQMRFPFPPEGHPSLSPIDLVQYLLDTNIAELLQDDPDPDVPKWSGSFRSFLGYCLKKDIRQRPTPENIMEHPWVAAMQKRKVDMERWIKEAWGWKN